MRFRRLSPYAFPAWVSPHAIRPQWAPLTSAFPNGLSAESYTRQTSRPNRLQVRPVYALRPRAFSESPRWATPSRAKPSFFCAAATVFAVGLDRFHWRQDRCFVHCVSLFVLLIDCRNSLGTIHETGKSRLDSPTSVAQYRRRERERPKNHSEQALACE